MQQALGRGLRPGIVAGVHHNRGASSGRSCILQRRRPVAVLASLEAPPAPNGRTDEPAAPQQLSAQQLQLLEQYSYPLVKITTHYHVNFGDCLKVVGSSPEFGAWNAADAPLMVWGEGDVWSLVLPLAAGDYEFKVVVQQANGRLVWEAGDDNRKVSVPEDGAPGSMLVSVCAFNIIDASAEPRLQPVTPDVVELLEAKLAEEAAAEDAKAAAAAQQAAADEDRARAVQAAAAVAKAIATMDAEAEVNGLRPRTMSDSDTDEPDTPSSAPGHSRAGPAVVAAAVADTRVAPAQVDQQQKQDVPSLPALEQPAVQQDTTELVAASTDAAGVPEPPVASNEEDVQQAVLAATADEEMQANLEVMSDEVHPDDVLASSSHAQLSPAAAVHAKLARDKPVAVGFVESGANHQASSSVVAAFMKSVSGSRPAAGSNEHAVEPVATATATATNQLSASLPTTQNPAGQYSDSTDTEPDADAVVSDSASRGHFMHSIKSSGTAVVAAAVVKADAAHAVGTASSGPLPKGWGHSANASSHQTATKVQARSSRASMTTGSSSYGFGSSSSMMSPGAGTPPNSPGKHHRPPSPGRGASHVVSAAAAAAVAAEWIESVRKNDVITAAREAEKAASELAARLQQARQKKTEAAAEAERLQESLMHNSTGRFAAMQVTGRHGSGGVVGNGGGSAAAVQPTQGTMGFVAAARSKVRSFTDATAALAGSGAISPPAVTPASMLGNDAYAAAGAAMSAAAASGLAPSPPAITGPPGSAAAPRSVTTQSLAVNSGTLATSGGVFDGAAEELGRRQGAGDGQWAEGMQFLAAVVGCAAVGTVMWSEFVLKETGCGLPPGPFGLLGAAEGLSYLTVLGFAGAGLGTRVSSAGKRGLPGALAVPETLAYGAVAAGLMVLASQLYTYGYIPPALPGGQCFADASVAVPGAEEVNDQLVAQVAALQSLLSQLQSAAADGLNQLHLQEQLATLQAQVDAFSGYVSNQATVLDAQLHTGLMQLQDSLQTATTSVSSFVDTQLQQLDVSGKLSYVLDILRTQEQQLKVELPKQLAELQQLAATSMAVVQETALQASSTSHLPELLSSLDHVMGMLHDTLETRIQQLDVVLTQLQGSIGAAAGQVAAAVAAAEQSGSAEAAAQLHGLQMLLSGAMADVQAQVWAGYQQLALADQLSDMLMTVRASAAAVAASSAAEVDKLRLQEQLQQLEGLAEASAAALAASAVDSLQQLHLDERLNDIAVQASVAASSLQTGLQQQYERQLPAMEAEMTSLQASLQDLASRTQQQLDGRGGPELESLLGELQQSMQSTMKLVGEVASTGVTAAGDVVQSANTAATSSIATVNEQLSGAIDAAGTTLASSFPEAVSSGAAADVAAPVAAVLQDSTPAAMDAPALADTLATAPAMFTFDTSAGVASQHDSVAPDVAAAAFGEAIESGMDFTALVAYALPDAVGVLQQLPNDHTFVTGGVNLSQAPDTIKGIWFNRPQ